MANILNMQQVLQSLIQRTRARQLRWDIDTGFDLARESPVEIRRESGVNATSVLASAYVCRLPHSIIRVRYYDARNAPAVAVLRIELPNGGLLGDWTIFDGDPVWNELQGLVQLIAEQCAQPVFEEFLRSIDEVSLDTNSTEHRGLASEEAALRFFKFAAGPWNLTYYRGNVGYHEELRIDESGNYFLLKIKDRPYFYLRDVYYDPENRSVSFAKVDATGVKAGKIRQTEVLQIDATGQSMKGYAQHDRHRLEYTRPDKRT